MPEIELGDFSTLRKPWIDLYTSSSNNLLFSSCDWSELWWKHFGLDSQLHLLAIRDNDQYIGIAPLRIQENAFRFIGSDNVCDFLDFIIMPGKETFFFQTLLKHLKDSSIRSFDLSPLLPNSSAYTYFTNISKSENINVSCQQIDVTVKLELPDNLESFLILLKGKQRHELLRKERRLLEEGEISFKHNDKVSSDDIDNFFRFFRDSRLDKNEFLTAEMESFFREVINNATNNHMLDMGILSLNGKPVAATLCFNYLDELFLYNSGYNPDYSSLSVGLLSKYFHIKKAIESRKQGFDFLKGDERYKYQLGGKELPIYNCIITK
jgi:CelD/BcsL family acetyltransferase involved in cellulose biosynthesis